MRCAARAQEKRFFHSGFKGNDNRENKTSRLFRRDDHTWARRAEPGYQRPELFPLQKTTRRAQLPWEGSPTPVPACSLRWASRKRKRKKQQVRLPSPCPRSCTCLASGDGDGQHGQSKATLPHPGMGTILALHSLFPQVQFLHALFREDVRQVLDRALEPRRSIHIRGRGRNFDTRNGKVMGRARRDFVTSVGASGVSSGKR